MEDYIMEVQQKVNDIITIQGTVNDNPHFSHSVRYEDFFEFTLCVKRMSDKEDYIPIVMPADLCKDLHKGMRVYIEGVLKSINKQVLENNGYHSKLLVYIFSDFFCELDKYEIDYNEVMLKGRICKNPKYRTTPFGREICDLMIAINNRYNKSYYIPIIAWGKYARYASNLHVNDMISLVGRFQSRVYDKKHDDGTVEKKTTYEVSAMEVSKVE